MSRQRSLDVGFKERVEEQIPMNGHPSSRYNKSSGKVFDACNNNNGYGRMDSSNSKTSNKKAQNGKANHDNPQSIKSWHEDGPLQHFHHTVFPLFLMFTTPNAVILIWYTAAKCDGSFIRLYEQLTDGGIFHGIMTIWMSIHIASPLCAAVITAYIIWALFLMIVVPGPRVEGPVTPNGHTPIYKDNGFSCYVITMVAFCIAAVGLRLFTNYSVTIIYDRFDEFLGTLTIYTHVLCISLHLKGLLWPSTDDSGTSGNLIFDYFMGTELYPRVAGIDIKVFTNCRFGLTVWPLLVCIYALKNYELYGFVDSTWVSAILQMIYLTKFFWWESGYMRTIDIMLDRAGYYLCWGCLVWVPGVYASVSMYLINHPVHLGSVLSITILILGTFSCAVNYLADRQKQKVRRSNGTCLVWGRTPKVINAEYNLNNGETRTSVLLMSGYWGIARHFHYIPELSLAFFWTLPALFQNFLPYTYFVILLILLIHRTYRDDTKCANKYGKYWKQYCQMVPYKIIPYVF